MKLYDFSHYARLRAERNAAKAVVDAVANLDRPGAVIALKQLVRQWYDLHSDYTRKQA